MIVTIFQSIQAKKTQKNIENGNREKSAGLTPLNLSEWAMPYCSDDDVWSHKLNFFYAKNPLQIQLDLNWVLW